MSRTPKQHLIPDGKLSTYSLVGLRDLPRLLGTYEYDSNVRRPLPMQSMLHFPA